MLAGMARTVPCNLPDPLSAAVQFPLLYQQLRLLARAHLAVGTGQSMLDTGALVHEVYLRMGQADGAPAPDGASFLDVAAARMRAVVVGAARRRRSERRGGDLERVPLDTEGVPDHGSDDDRILAIDAALGRLRRIDRRLAQVVELRFFVGLSEVDIGRALGVSDRSVRRYWDRARLLLAEMLGA